MHEACTSVSKQLRNWKNLMHRVANYKEKKYLFSMVGMHQIESVYVELQFLMALLLVFEINWDGTGRVNVLVNRIRYLAYKARKKICSIMEVGPPPSNIKIQQEEINPFLEELMQQFLPPSNIKIQQEEINPFPAELMQQFLPPSNIIKFPLPSSNRNICKVINESVMGDTTFSNILKEIKSINTLVWRIHVKKYDMKMDNCCSARAVGDHPNPNLLVDEIVVASGSGSGVDFLLENLKQLTNHEDECYLFSPAEMEQAQSLYEELGSLRTFLVDVEMIRHDHQRLQDLVNQIIDLAYDAEDIIYSIKFCHDFTHQNLVSILKEIESIKIAVAGIYKKKFYGIGDPQLNIMSSNNNTSGSSRTGDSIAEDETVVGFVGELETIKERLAGGSDQIDVISIVGMAGLGKTTLAKILYNDPYVVYHFYIRGWTYVSQVYRRRDLLLEILYCFVENKEKLYTMSDEKLAEQLYKCLKGQRYLIVLDDVWDVRPWDDLRRCFPNDNNGSRIILTSRHTNVAVKVKSDSPPHPLRFLTEEESWDLFEHKVFWKESCPPYLLEKGREIVQKCGGLPLAIVVIAGLLSKTDKTLDWWRQVAGSVSSYIASSDPEQCMKTLFLSYNHLPHHLKSCFLYFGAFPEDHEIRVKKLMCLWIAEGFIRQIGQRTLEDVAEEYLMDLIDRSLVLVSKKRSTGGIKACRVHDMLRDLCLRKAEEEIFLRCINGHATKQPFMFNNSRWTYNDNSLFLPIEKEVTSLHDQVSKGRIAFVPKGRKKRRIIFIPKGTKKRRMSINSFTLDCSFSLHSHPLCIRSLLCFESEESSSSPNNMSSKYGAFKLLKVLDLSAIKIACFPLEILTLVLLRYLALQGKELSLPASISDLWNLETLIVSKVIRNKIPPNIWKMVRLRHLRIGGENDIEFPQETDNDGFPSTLNNLQTISQVCPSSPLENVLARTLNLQKLVLRINSSRGQHFPCLRLDFLNHLEVLYLLNRNRYGQLNSLKGFTFPLNLKRLTLSDTGLQWMEMSIVGMLPNLEALKLEYEACVGPRWDTSEGGFHQLKYLRLYYINIQQWNAFSIHFPNLRHLVLSRCKDLKEIPSDFGNMSTLGIVEVNWCSSSSMESARKIREEQQSLGNDWLKILINPPQREEQQKVLV